MVWFVASVGRDRRLRVETFESEDAAGTHAALLWGISRVLRVVVGTAETEEDARAWAPTVLSKNLLDGLDAIVPVE